MQLFNSPQDFSNLASSRYQKNIEQKLKKTNNKDSVIINASLLQSNVFEYDSPNKKEKSFNLPPRQNSPPKFGEVVVQEIEDDPDKIDVYVAKNIDSSRQFGVYEQRVKQLEGT
jgi:hypothetical protein